MLKLWKNIKFPNYSRFILNLYSYLFLYIHSGNNNDN